MEHEDVPVQSTSKTSNEHSDVLEGESSIEQINEQNSSITKRFMKCIRKGDRVCYSEPESIIVRGKVPEGRSTTNELRQDSERPDDSIHSGESIYKNLSFDQIQNEVETAKCLAFWKSVMEKNLEPIRCTLIRCGIDKEDDQTMKTESGKREINGKKKQKSDTTNHRLSKETHTDTAASHNEVYSRILEKIKKKNLDKIKLMIKQKCKTCELLESTEKDKVYSCDVAENIADELKNDTTPSVEEPSQQTNKKSVNKTPQQTQNEGRKTENQTINETNVDIQEAEDTEAKPAELNMSENNKTLNSTHLHNQRTCGCHSDACECKHELASILKALGKGPCHCNLAKCTCQENLYLTPEPTKVSENAETDSRGSNVDSHKNVSSKNKDKESLLILSYTYKTPQDKALSESKPCEANTEQDASAHDKVTEKISIQNNNCILDTATMINPQSSNDESKATRNSIDMQTQKVKNMQRSSEIRKVCYGAADREDSINCKIIKTDKKKSSCDTIKEHTYNESVVSNGSVKKVCQCGFPDCDCESEVPEPKPIRNLYQCEHDVCECEVKVKKKVPMKKCICGCGHLKCGCVESKSISSLIKDLEQRYSKEKRSSETTETPFQKISQSDKHIQEKLCDTSEVSSNESEGQPLLNEEKSPHDTAFKGVKRKSSIRFSVTSFHLKNDDSDNGQLSLKSSSQEDQADEDIISQEFYKKGEAVIVKPSYSKCEKSISSERTEHKSKEEIYMLNRLKEAVKQAEKEYAAENSDESRYNSIGIQCKNIEPEIRERKYCYICGHYNCPCEVTKLL